MENVILVDEFDNALGEMEKMEAHRKGKLHRAFSIFIFNDKNELLLQQRAMGKYHSGGLWSNTCCSHPRVNEHIIAAGNRRLMEEMGIKSELQKQFSFIYRAKLDNELTEYELDHVLFGQYNGLGKFNKEEVMDVRYANLDEIEQELMEQPEIYTAWFKLIFDRTKSLISRRK
ncbi:MAG: isopentenyl-diphosphate delta-isomerase [Crocinitomicaceae bacterium]|jgi:isopentenyl-diphosphate delta-isomerase